MERGIGDTQRISALFHVHVHCGLQAEISSAWRPYAFIALPSWSQLVHHSPVRRRRRSRSWFPCFADPSSMIACHLFVYALTRNSARARARAGVPYLRLLLAVRAVATRRSVARYAEGKTPSRLCVWPSNSSSAIPAAAAGGGSGGLQVAAVRNWAIVADAYIRDALDETRRLKSIRCKPTQAR